MRSSNTLHAFWVFLGSLASFGFAIISSMILSRFFDKNDYGTYKQVMYVYSTLLVVFTLGVPRAYSFFLPRVRIAQAKNLISKINKILFVSGLFMSVILFLGAKVIASFLGNTELTTPLKYFSIVPIFMLPTMGVEGVLSVYKKSLWIATYSISTRLLMLFCVVLPVTIYNGSVEQAIIGFTISSLFSFIIAMVLKYYPLKNIVHEATSISYSTILRYTIPIMMAGIWGVVIRSSDLFFISKYFGTEVFAEFSNGALEIPIVGMIVSAGAVILSPLYSKHGFENTSKSKAEILRLWNSVFVKTAKMIYPIVIFCLFFATEIMIFLYGDLYEASGSYFQIKLLGNFFTLISYGPLLLSIGGEKYYRDVHMYAAIFTVFFEYSAVCLIDTPLAIVWISVIFTIARIIAMLAFISRHYKVSLVSLIPVELITKILAPSFVFLYVIRLCLEWLFNLEILFLMFFSGLLYIFLYGAWARIVGIEYLSIIRPLLTHFKRR